jgi:hypothetical protein
MPQIVQLKNFGQFGNALFQYAFARAYAEKYNAELQTSYWIGQHLFNLRDPKPSFELRLLLEADCNPKVGIVNVELCGYFQNPDCLSLYSREKVMEWFKFKQAISSYFPKKHPFYVAWHFRRGDYVRMQDRLCIPTEESYGYATVGILAKYGLPKNTPIVIVSEETAEFYDDPELSFLPDFFTLMQAGILLRANSTFSWWAGTLGSGLIYSPVVNRLVGHQDVKFVPGNGEPLLSYPLHGRLDLP